MGFKSILEVTWVTVALCVHTGDDGAVQCD